MTKNAALSRAGLALGVGIILAIAVRYFGILLGYYSLFYSLGVAPIVIDIFEWLVRIILIGGPLWLAVSRTKKYASPPKKQAVKIPE